MKSASALALAALILLPVAPSAAVGGDDPPPASDWWRIPYPEPFDAAALPAGLDVIRVDGKRLVDESGETVIVRGVSIGDPDKLELAGRWSRELFAVIDAWGADVVRVPVHPVAWRGRGKAGYFRLLDQAVVWASELGLYLMIDWHSIGNLQSGLYQHPMYDTSRRETLDFWRSVAHRYRGVPAVAFYEIFNEPTTYHGTLGRASWERWKEINEEIVEIIFAHDRDVVPLVAGFDWAYDLKPVAEAPLDVEGIGYVSHPYPQKVEPPWEEKWERDFGFVADRYPVVVTEFGYMGSADPGAHVPTIDDGDYGPRILDFLARQGISWVAWCFDPDWGPRLISDWDYTPTAAGAFFRDAMRDGSR